MLFRSVSKERLHERGDVNLIFRARRDIRGIHHIYFTDKQPWHIKDNGPGRSHKVSGWTRQDQNSGPPIPGLAASQRCIRWVLLRDNPSVR